MSNLHERGPRTRDPLIYRLKNCLLMLADQDSRNKLLYEKLPNYGPVENIELGKSPDEEKERCCPHQTLLLVEYLYMYNSLNLFPRYDICASACIYVTYLPQFSLFSFFSSQTSALELWVPHNPCGLRI